MNSFGNLVCHIYKGGVYVISLVQSAFFSPGDLFYKADIKCTNNYRLFSIIIFKVLPFVRGGACQILFDFILHFVVVKQIALGRKADEVAGTVKPMEEGGGDRIQVD